MFRPIVTVALCAAWQVLATDYSVAPGVNTIQTQLVSVADGDTLLLDAGVYELDRFVHVTKAVQIVGTAGTIVRADSTSVPAAFYIDALGASIKDITLEDSSTGSSCQFEDPQPLNISFMYDLYDAPKGMHIYSNSLVIAGDAGPYFNTRALTDIHFGSCKLSTDSNKMSRGFLEIQTVNCRANAGVSVAFNYMTNCGATVTDLATITTYDAAVELNFEEEITMDDFEESDFFAFSHLRTGEALAQMSISIDRLNKICTDVHVRTDEGTPSGGGNNGTDPTDGDSIIEKINAAITDLDLAAINDNTSVVEISLVVPCPHGIYPLDSTGGVLVDKDSMEDDQTTVSDWVVTGDCAEECQNENSYCMQKLSFQITSCDLTATYHIQNLPLACVPGIVGCEDEGQHANITFNIDTNGLCEEDPFQLSDAFEPTVRLRSDDTFQTDRDTNAFTPDRSDTYWTIELWTNKTALIIKSAEIQKVERHYANELGEKIEGSCGENDYFYNDDDSMTQMELDAILKPVFHLGVGDIMMDATNEAGELVYDDYGEVVRVLDPNHIPPKIDTIIPMTDKWLCEAGETVETMQNASSYMFCWYVIVEYEDSTARRRRRSIEEDSWKYDAFADIEDVQHIGGMDFMKRREVAGGIGHGLLEFVPFAEGEFSSRNGIEDIEVEDDAAEQTSITMAVGIGAGVVFGTVGLILCVIGAFYVKSQRAKEKEMMVYQKAFYPQGGMSAGGPPGQTMQPGGSMYQSNQNGGPRGSLNNNSGASSMYNRGGHGGGSGSSRVSQRSSASQRSGHDGAGARAGGSFYGMEEHSSV
ncbi:hypothetical protein SARC_03264 [Sphaeroforma arctica JP610]|uniref:Uncharacterized protein n=1 Tax=Sphaeroforma arctica JP610 TaxID=667725 RepID=A0A0L0G8E9_9EUKA|nr:hypothetical protein SARC_03264 [Sphaeroforma arctica JP610]KNC84518.1 hypothetical protein SARC_03264 [Sphaeroforma arctica JP610]|eukprot:XP_014158420.1 hypothetical protein SARC_03264 [Sphaeroforma arctica JP610]